MEDSSNQIQEVEEGDQSRGELQIQPQLPSDQDKESISEEAIEQGIEGDPEV